MENEDNLTLRLPNEVMGHILSYLPTRDLLNCSEVCSRWNEIAKHTLQYWKRRCAKYEWRQPRSLTETARNTSIEMIADMAHNGLWQIYFKQRMFLQSNWECGTYETQQLLGRNTFISNHLTYASDSIMERNYLCIVQIDTEAQGEDQPPAEGATQHNEENVYKVFILKLDGEPRVVCNLGNYGQSIDYVCISEEYIIFLDKLKVRHCKLQDGNFVLLDKCYMIPTLGEGEGINYQRDQFYLGMNEKYILAGHQCNSINIWCRDTDSLLVTVLCPPTASCMANIIIHDDLLIYNTWLNAAEPAYMINVFNIPEKNVVFSRSTKLQVKKLLAFENYLVVVLVNSSLDFKNKLAVWDMTDQYREKWYVQHDIHAEPDQDVTHVYIHNRFVFFCENPEQFKMVRIEDCSTYKIIPLFENYPINSINFVSHNLMVVQVFSHVYVFNWEAGERLYTIDDSNNEGELFVNDFRIILRSDNQRLRMISYW